MDEIDEFLNEHQAQQKKENQQGEPEEENSVAKKFKKLLKEFKYGFDIDFYSGMRLKEDSSSMTRSYLYLSEIDKIMESNILLETPSKGRKLIFVSGSSFSFPAFRLSAKSAIKILLSRTSGSRYTHSF